jgi:branched-chain amino acid transport system substrate-binding protein
MPKAAGVSRRSVITTAIAGAAAVTLPAMPRSASAAEPIKIGCPVALTGTLGSIGAQMLRAIQFWAKEVNAKGGLLGRQVQLLIEDTTGNPATSVRKAQEMVERQGVRIITGIVASNEALAVCPKLAEWDTIFVSGDNGDGRLTAESLVPNFFRPNVSGPMGTRVVALYLRESPMKTFYGMGMDYAWGHNSLEVFEAEVKRAGKTYLGSVFSPIGTKDYSTYVTKIRESGANGVYTVLAGDDQNAFLTQAKQYRLSDKTQIMTEIVDGATADAVGDAAIGMIGSSRYPYTYDCPANKVYVAAWQKEYGRMPDVFEGDQYQSCVVLQAGIEKAGSTESGKLRAALEGVVIDSIKGKVTMRACDHQGVQQGFMVKVVKTAGMAKPAPEVIAIYPADKVTPACNKMTYDN